MNQLIKFNPTAGGKTPNMCLANVCAGFGIPNKYASAWEAWENTQQHTDAIPDGLDVPVFFSYSATIDGQYENWGHVGVRLASGQFWSDGNIYDSIDAYLVNHWPKYVGWGESINDVKVIGEQEMPLTPTQIDEAFKLAGITDFQEDLANPDYANNPGLLIDTLFNQAGARPNHSAELDAANAKIADLEKQLAEKPSPALPPTPPGTPPTPVTPTPDAGQGSVQKPNNLQLLVDWLIKTIIGKKG